MRVADACLSTAMRAFNQGDRVLRGLGHGPPTLNPDRLLQSARRATGLTDVGVEGIHGPMERLAEALEREAKLTLFGRLTARRYLVSLLETALLLQRDRRLWPAVIEQRITAPVFIVGLPRTGTTLLHNLLVRDPESRAPLTWETMFPAGYPEAPPALRRAKWKASARLAMANRIAPDFRRIHPAGFDRPEECVALMAPGFASAVFHTLYRVPSYQDWFESDRQTTGLEMHFHMLQQLQFRRGKTRWVLKCPAHLFSLDALLRRYPDARLIQTHRDPLRAIPSIASLTTTLRAAFSSQVDPCEIGRDCTRRWSRALERFLHRRDSLLPDRVVDVAYSELVASPIGVVERIYDQLGWRISPAARAGMEDYMAANPRNASGVHRYSPQAFGLDAGQEARRFASYRDRFKIVKEHVREFPGNRSDATG